MCYYCQAPLLEIRKNKQLVAYWQCGLIKEIFLFFLLFQFLFLMVFLVLLLTTYLRNHSNLIGNNYKFTCRLNIFANYFTATDFRISPLFDNQAFKTHLEADNIILPTCVKTFFSPTEPISPHFRHSRQHLKTSHPSCNYSGLPELVLCKSEIRAQS